MACKKSELVAAINAFAAARESGDVNLIAFASRLVEQTVETLEFEPEEGAAPPAPIEPSEDLP